MLDTVYWWAHKIPWDLIVETLTLLQSHIRAGHPWVSPRVSPGYLEIHLYCPIGTD